MDNRFRYLRACAWGGPILLLVTIIFWGIFGHNVPPFSADQSADAIAEQFRPLAQRIKLGMVVELPFSALYLTWGVAITKLMEEIELDNNVLSTLQLWGAGLTTMIFVIPCAGWLGVTYRAETMPSWALQMIYDMWWILFDLAYALTTLQMIPLGICLLSDKRAVPLFPRWMGWFSIWVGLMFFLESFMSFFKGGPFSRSGILNYWTEFTLFFAFMALVSFYLLKAIGRLERETRLGAPRG